MTAARYVTAAETFVDGAVGANELLQFVNVSSGAVLPTQIDRKNVYPSGNARFVLVTVDLNGISTAISYKLRKTGFATPGAATTLAAALAAGMQAVVTMTIGGTVYTGDLNYMLSNLSYTTWRSGPLVTEWMVIGPVRTSGGTAHAQIQVKFYAKYFANGDYYVKARVENCKTFTSGRGDISLSNITVTVGANTVYSAASLTHRAAGHWTKEGWQDSAIISRYYQQDVTNLWKTKAIPRLRPGLTPTATALNALPTTYTPMALNGLPNNWDGTGAADHIGMLPKWCSLWIASNGDRRAFNGMVINSYAQGGFQVNYRDENTGEIPLITAHPTISISNDGSTEVGTSNPNVYSSRGDDTGSHAPSIGYLPYLVTGDYDHLENTQMLTNHIVMWPSSSWRGGGGANGILGIQLRSMGWGMRDLARAAYITPDSSAIKTYFTTIINNNLVALNNAYTNNINASPWGDCTGSVIPYYDGDVGNGGADSFCGVKCWQDDYVTYGIGVVTELVPSAAATSFLNWKLKFIMTRLGLTPDTGFCNVGVAPYIMYTRNTSGSAFDSNAAGLYTRNWGAGNKNGNPNIAAQTCGSSAQAGVGGISVGQFMNSGVSNVEYYLSYTRLSAHLAADNGFVNGVAAYNSIINSVNFVDVAHDQDTPSWCAYPRTFA